MSRYIHQGTLEELSHFLSYVYLEDYVAKGGSKIKFAVGSEGSGKSYFLSQNQLEANKLGFKTVYLSARETPLYDFKEFYASIIKSCNVEDIVCLCADEVIKRCGYSPDEIPENTSFLDYLASKEEADALTRRSIRRELKSMFLDNPYCDNNFALAFSMLTGDKLGHPSLDETSKSTIYSWLYCQKELKMAALRLAGLSPSKISKLNARHMLSSLVEILLLSGYKGLCVYIDDFDAILNRTGLDAIHYTKMRREDTYESVRELIDAIDSMKNVFFLFGFERSLLDDESTGLKSYQALWMRIQNEIKGSQFNCFADILDIDRYGQCFYNAESLRKLYNRFVAAYTNPNLDLSIDDETLLRIKEKASQGSLGVLALLEDAIQEKIGASNYAEGAKDHE